MLPRWPQGCARSEGKLSPQQRSCELQSSDGVVPLASSAEPGFYNGIIYNLYNIT